MTKIKRGLILALGASMVSALAFAGQTNPVTVVVEIGTGGGSAFGDMITARTSEDDTSYIGCGTRNTDNGVGGLFSWAFCQAQDAEGDQATCFVFDNDLIQTIREINDGSFITFSWTDDGTGLLTCSSMGFSTQSFYIGKEVKGNKPE